MSPLQLGLLAALAGAFIWGAIDAIRRERRANRYRRELQDPAPRESVRRERRGEDRFFR